MEIYILIYDMFRKCEVKMSRGGAAGHLAAGRARMAEARQRSDGGCAAAGVSRDVGPGAAG